MIRRGALLAAMLALVAGLIAMRFPRLAAVSGYWTIITIAGLIAGIAILHQLSQATIVHRMEAYVPSVEQRAAADSPGQSVDDLLTFSTPPASYPEQQRTLQSRYAKLVHDALTAFSGYSPTAATTAIKNGTWSNDRLANAFVSAAGLPSTVSDRVRTKLTRSDPFERAARQCLLAVESLIPFAPATAERHERGFLTRLGAPRAGVQNVHSRTVATGHWKGIALVALSAIVLGVFAESGELLFGGVIGLGYLVYAASGEPPDPQLTITRDLEPTDPEPGQEVTVSVTVQNVGDRWLPDLRLVDGVPPGLLVIDGAARHATALFSGQSDTFHYRIEAARGNHEWEELTVIARSLNGSYETNTSLDEPTAVRAMPAQSRLSRDLPLQPGGASSIGQLKSRESGEGLEFQSLREYRPGDRRSRIDWHRFARLGELTTIEFREERATTVVIAIDARKESYSATTPDEPHTVARSVAAAERVAVSLLTDGNRVGLTSLSPVDSLWIQPRVDSVQAVRIREVLATHPSLAQRPPRGQFRPLAWVTWLQSRLTTGSQVLLISPLCDDLIEDSSYRIEAAGYSVTVISPDPTTTDSFGRRTIRAERRVRLARMRQRGLQVIDWPPDEPLDTSMLRIAGRVHA